MFSATEQLSARLHLLKCLTAIRGGEDVHAELIERDYLQWVAEHGEPTPENVDRWAATDFELGFALKLLQQRAMATN